MRLRWLDLGVLPGLACLTESLWLSVVAALIAQASWPALLGGTLAIVGVPTAATVAARASRLSVRVARMIVGVAALSSTAALVGLQPHTPLSRATALALADLLFVVVASWLGIRIGERAVHVDDALGRAARALGLIFLALLLAAALHQPFATAGVAVTVVIAAGALLVALARLGESLTMVDRRHGVSGWTWFAGILATIAAILLIAVILAALMHGAPLLWTLSAIAHGLLYLLQGVAFVVASAGYALLRVFVWIFGLFHVHRPEWLQPGQPPQLHTTRLPHVATGGGGSTLLHDVAWPLLAAIVGGGLLFLLLRAVRRLREGEPSEPQEERESLLSAADLLSSARVRLSHLVARLPRRQAPPSSPAEAVRREFTLLERALAALGETRHPDETARRYLLRTGTASGVPSRDLTTVPVPPGRDGTRERLISGYETARYSQHPLSWQDAAAFRSLAREYVERARVAAGRPDAT